jgi:hypothetical protein
MWLVAAISPIVSKMTSTKRDLDSSLINLMYHCMRPSKIDSSLSSILLRMHSYLHILDTRWPPKLRLLDHALISEPTAHDSARLPYQVFGDTSPWRWGKVRCLSTKKEFPRHAMQSLVLNIWIATSPEYLIVMSRSAIFLILIPDGTIC